MDGGAPGSAVDDAAADLAGEGDGEHDVFEREGRDAEENGRSRGKPLVRVHEQQYEEAGGESEEGFGAERALVGSGVGGAGFGGKSGVVTGFAHGGDEVLGLSEGGIEGDARGIREQVDLGLANTGGGTQRVFDVGLAGGAGHSGDRQGYGADVLWRRAAGFGCRIFGFRCCGSGHWGSVVVENLYSTGTHLRNPAVTRKSIPQGVKARRFFGVRGTAEAVPLQSLFPNSFLGSLISRLTYFSAHLFLDEGGITGFFDSAQ